MNRRRLAIMRLLNSRKKYTARELAQRFEVSIRTIQRDLTALQELGMPVYTEVGAHGGYQVLQNGILPPLQLRLQEAYGIYLMMEWLEKIQDMPYGSIREALSEYYAHDLPSEVQDRIDRTKEHIMFIPSVKARPAPYTTEVLNAAIDRRKLKFTYAGRTGMKQHEVFPLGLYYDHGFWYMPAQKDDGKTLLFRLDRMDAAEMLEERGGAVPSLKEWFHRKERPQGHAAVIVFTDIGQRLAENDPIFADLKEGVWRGEIPESELAYTARRLLSYGPEVKVLEPDPLKEQVRLLLIQSLKQYEE
ncbi:helix-turn-helix transcriptional regulator [Paenibacillus provencensis]|uniref:Helix-turn-helix transcriptional regulator n=1 Tax=Paenibacillus provencensis TaxID=441151 RepID=A0ABW3Q2L6_9BACL|nr:YafY family protein [Paenibacillus sp. MER 78]MCM3128576.1 YafY family transcriptional regulator [Paenibacillus sp. MER 78]